MSFIYNQLEIKKQNQTKNKMTSLIYREVSCRKAVSGDEFTRGVQDYDF